MKQGGMSLMYALLTLGVFFIALGNAYRFLQSRNGRPGVDPLAKAYADRLAAAEGSVALFTFCLLVSNIFPVIRIFRPWFMWWYWIGMGILLIGRLQLAFFIHGNLRLRKSKKGGTMSDESEKDPKKDKPDPPRGPKPKPQPAEDPPNPPPTTGGP